MYKMSLTITPSDVANHPFILNGSTTSNVTYTITNAGAGGVTYNITGADADKFVVTYATAANDSTQQATLTLNTAAVIETQILYKINLVATDVANPGFTSTKIIGIFVSSDSTAYSVTALIAITAAGDLTSLIPELDFATKATYRIIQTNVDDELNMTAAFSGGTGGNFNIDVERIGGVNYITLVRKTGADGGDATSETASVILTYLGSGHGNVDATPSAVSDPSYVTPAMTLTVTYTPVQIEFYESAYVNAVNATPPPQRESGDNVAAAGAVVDYYNGTTTAENGGADAGCVTLGFSADTKTFPIFLNQQCVWTVTGTDEDNFSVYSDEDATTTLISSGPNAADKAVTAYVKFDPLAATNYAAKNYYDAIITVTDGGASGSGTSTGSRTLAVKVAVSTDATAPVINDISFNGSSFAGSITSNAVAFDVDESTGVADHAVFKLDTTKHGTNDPIISAVYYLVQTGAAAGGVLTTLAVPSVSGSNTATFSVTLADVSSNKEATISVDSSGITFDDNYDATNNNVYKFGIFANDSEFGGTNSSAVIEITITVKNTTGMRYTGQDGSQTIAAVVSNGVVTNTGTTNSSIVEFSFVANIPASATAITTSAITANPTDLETDGTYSGVATTDGTGTGATFDVTVLGGTITAAVAAAAGTGYTTGDVLTMGNANIGVSTNTIDATITLTIDAAAPAAGATNTAAALGITLLDGSSVDQIALVSNVVVTDVAQPLASMASTPTVKKFTFSVSAMTNSAEYTLTMPTLTPAISHQNVSGQTVVLGQASAGGALPAANGLVNENTMLTTFVFTYNTASEYVSFHGPDSVSWARGHPYTEIFYASGETMSALASVTAYGAKHNGESGNKMSYYNSVDPTAAAGAVGYFTWTVTNAAGGQSSRTRTVTIKADADYAGNTPRGQPDLRQDTTANLTFAGTGSTAAQPAALDYAGIKETTSPTNNAAGVALRVSRTTALTVSDRGTLWAYAVAGSGVTGNASIAETYQVVNEDVYAFDFGTNNTDVSQKSAEWVAGTAGATVAAPAAPHISKSGKKQNNIFNFSITSNPTDLVTDATYTGVASTVSPAGGTGATFDVIVANGTISSITANAVGTGYSTSDVITIAHGLIGVSTSVADATIRNDLDTGANATWDTAFVVGGVDITGTRTITIVENTGHIITIDLAGLNIDSTIAQVFTLQAAADFSATIADFAEHATCNIAMDKADFNNIFYYKPESPGITTAGVGTVWSNLLTSPSLRSETIELLQKEENWPVMKSGNATGTTVGTTNELYAINAAIPGVGTTSAPKFETAVPTVNPLKISDIVVENWTFDLFGVKEMADIFETTSDMKTEINDYLTSPGATEANTTTFEGSIRTNLAALTGSLAVETRLTGENDAQAIINARPAQFLLYALRDKIQDTATAHYRLTTNVGGMFHSSNKIINVGGNDDGYFPFIWQTGDKITVGANFKHADVNAGTLFNGGDATKPLGDLPFKYVITLV